MLEKTSLKNKYHSLVNTFVLSLLPLGVVVGDELTHRHGAIDLTDQAPGMKIAGGAAYTLQNVKGNHIDNTSFASIDLLISKKFQRGELSIYFEANTTPHANSVASRIGGSNGDAGSALDKNDFGRIQLSDFHYTHFAPNSEYAIGLVDITGFFDQSEYAADETSKFLAGPLVHNPTIEFPDYTLSMIYDRHRNINIKAVIASSHGLGDNEDRDYGSLIDVTKSGKGVFAAMEGDIDVKSFSVKLGGWINSAEHENLVGSSTDEINYGIYTSIDRKFGKVGTNLRLGWANSEVSETDKFMSIAAEVPIVRGSLGLGVAYMGLASDAEAVGRDDSILAEAYYNFELTENSLLTPSLQLVRNNEFDSSGDVFDKNLKIVNMRVSINF